MIKSISKVCIVALLLVGSLQAEDKDVTMRTMLDGINLIQLGLLTNTHILIKEGVLELKNSKKELGKIDHSRYLSLDEVQGYAYTKEKIELIEISANTLESHAEAGEKIEALQSYAEIMQQCIECHAKLRDYEDEGTRFR